MNKRALEQLENSIKNEPDDFHMFRDDLLGWIELIKGGLSFDEVVVLDHLKYLRQDCLDSVMEAIGKIESGYDKDSLPEQVKKSYGRFTNESEFRVTKAFIEWDEKQTEDY